MRDASRDGHPYLYRTTDYGTPAGDLLRPREQPMRVVREDPVDPNVLYAGSVTSAYVSFDRGDHWHPCSKSARS
jgi:hypothetical protein